MRALAVLLLLASSVAVTPRAFADERSEGERASWCAPELEALPGDACVGGAAPTAEGRRVLVIFLHGVIQPETTWQWSQQRGFSRNGRRAGVTVLMPRGRRGIGPPGMTDWITWPTSAAAQGKVEDEILAEWSRARAMLEERAGRAFDEVFVMGFSNGAYYATSLALRGRLAVQGFAAFAGGSAPAYLVKAAAKTIPKRPIFVGIATKDATTVKAARKLGKALRDLGWPSKLDERPVGHAVADASFDGAIAFLRGGAGAKAAR